MNDRPKSNSVPEFDVNNLSKVPDPGEMNERGAGCQTGVCVNNRAFGASMFCDEAVCVDGVGECKQRT